MRIDDEPNDTQRADADALVMQLFAQHAHLLKRNLSRICPQQDKLDDLVQDSFIALRRVLSSQSTTDPVRNPIALLYPITKRILTDQIRREMAADRFSQPLEESASQVPDPVMRLDDRMCRDESLRLRQQIVNDLPAEQRRVVLRRLDGFKAVEIARKMNVSPMRVYQLLRLATERCKRRWRESGMGDGQ